MALVYRRPFGQMSPADTLDGLLERQGVEKGAVARLSASFIGDSKDNPARLQGLHGPFEELYLLRHGKLPDSYYVEGDPEPWGYTPDASRSNLLWQVVSGMLDRLPDFGAAYLSLALDKSLSADDYRHELTALNASFRRYVDGAGASRDHHHSSMSSIYHAVSCQSCSILTSLACQDPAMHALFMDMIPLAPADRHKLLESRGLTPLLAVVIPDAPGPGGP